MPAPRIHTFTDGRAGNAMQAAALAAHVAALCGGAVTHHVLSMPAAARPLPVVIGRRFARFRGAAADAKAPPDIAIGCGAAAQTITLAMKQQYGAFAVFIQRPRGRERYFDAIVAPRHDYTAEEIAAIEARADAKTLLTLGAVGGITPESPARARDVARAAFAPLPPPFIAALIGGDNSAYRPDAALLTAQLKEIAAASGATLLITPSRRSGRETLAALQDAFGGRHYVWDGGGDNPYPNIMAAADAYCVTMDSVNMLSEACAGGRAVYWLRMQKKSGWRARRTEKKFARFRAGLQQRGHARPWRGEWRQFSAPPLAEAARAAGDIWRRFQRARPPAKGEVL